MTPGAPAFQLRYSGRGHYLPPFKTKSKLVNTISKGHLAFQNTEIFADDGETSQYSSYDEVKPEAAGAPTIETVDEHVDMEPQKEPLPPIFGLARWGE